MLQVAGIIPARDWRWATAAATGMPTVAVPGWGMVAAIQVVTAAATAVVLDMAAATAVVTEMAAATAGVTEMVAVTAVVTAEEMVINRFIL